MISNYIWIFFLLKKRSDPWHLEEANNMNLSRLMGCAYALLSRRRLLLGLSFKNERYHDWIVA